MEHYVWNEKTLEKLNTGIKETIQHYYKNQDAESFFKIDAILSLCREQNLTREEVPQLIEMQNIIVMG